MSDQKRQAPVSEKEEEEKKNEVDDNASEQDMKIQLSNTKVRNISNKCN